MRIRIAIITISAAVLSVTAASGADTGIKTKVESFPVSSVRLTSGPFKHAEDMDIRYLLALDPDRLLAPYRKGAGLEPKAENYTNWEIPDLTDISEVTMCQRLHICMQLPVTKR